MTRSIRGTSRPAAALALTVSAAAACFVDIPTDDPVPSACAARNCSEHAYCNAGDCFCDPNYVGNPDALHGCQPVDGLSPCDTTCGLNAFCDGTACSCAEGFVAVCGTGDCIPIGQLCDGTPDCVNGSDEDPMVCFAGSVQTWTLEDACDDGLAIQWRVFSMDRDWLWPGPDAVFTSVAPHEPSYESVECLDGELLCFGAQAGDRQWGIGLDGRGECDDCCQPCASDTVELAPLACE
ncbi:MAG: hypothetical protein IPH07_01820 [Deltaproteobacteria bacterium]|nr:hypothetical protein [Deltaproteobacteria bacterium]MBP7290604.1 hypothetical protein [Nannocystaceae bacterium]